MKKITIEEARITLGAVGKSMTDQEIQNIISLFSSMASSWLNACEVKTFGQTVCSLTSKQGGTI